MSVHIVREEAEAIPVRVSGEGREVWYFHDEVLTATGPVVESLADRFRVFAPIHPGFGTSPRPDWVRTVEDIADLYVDRVLEAGGEQPVLIGSSIGAWIAADVALLLSGQVEQLVLIGPLGLRVKGHPVADHWFVSRDDRDAILYHHPANKPEVEADEYIANEAMFARLGWNPRMVGLRLRPRLARLGVPTTVIWGEEDSFVPAAHIAEWEACLPNATTVLIPGSGHYPVYEQPAALNARIAEALDALTATAVEP